MDGYLWVLVYWKHRSMMLINEFNNKSKKCSWSCSKLLQCMRASLLWQTAATNRRCNAQKCKVHIAYRHRYTDIDVCRTPFCLLHFTLYCIAVAESAHILNRTNSPYICAQARELAWLNFLPIGHQSEKQRRSSEFNFNSITFPSTFN